MEKNSEMEAALEEAIVCGEIKSEEAKELQAKLTASMKDQTSLKAQVSNLTELQHKVEEKLKSEKKEAQIQLQSLVVEKEKLISTHHFELKQLKAQHQREVSESNKNNERHETQVIKTHKVNMFYRDTVWRAWVVFLPCRLVKDGLMFKMCRL